MSEALTRTQKQLKEMVHSEAVQQRLQECMGKRANQFATSMLSLVAQDKMLAESEPATILQSAMTAATLDLPIQKDLGFAWIIAYRDNKNNRTVAQFQMGYKGYIQLAMRTGQYALMNAEPVPQSAYKGRDEFGEPVIDWNEIDSGGDVGGYAFVFRLVNGFTKKTYWPMVKVQAHAKRFSQSFRGGYGPWRDDFDAMALKTVVKNTLSKWGMLSVEMQQAFASDQTSGDEYIDNPKDDNETIDVNPVSAKLAKNNAAKTADTQTAPEAAETKEAAMPHPAVMAETIGVPLAVLKEYAIAHGMTVTSFTGVSRENREAMLADPTATKAAINAWMDAQNQG